MTKQEQISEIKRIINEWGSVTSSELELESSPCVNSIGNSIGNISQLVEHFYSDGVEAVTYHDEIELGEEYIYYENLNENTIDEIYHIIEQYELSMIKTEKRASN